MSHKTPQPLLTCSKLIQKLREKKMNNEWRWSRYGFTAGNGKTYLPKQLTIIFTRQFDGTNEPGGAKNIYVIRSHDGLLGFSLDACGMYNDPEDRKGFENFIRQIPAAHPEEAFALDL